MTTSEILNSRNETHEEMVRLIEAGQGQSERFRDLANDMEFLNRQLIKSGWMPREFQA